MRERNRFTLLLVAFSIAIFFHLHVVTLSYSGQDRKNNEAQTETKSESVHASVVAVDIAKEQNGYGGSALKGTIQGGFTQTMLPSGFALNLEDALPQPDSCAW